MGLTKKGIAFPSGLVAGQKLSFLLKSLTLGTVGVESFDALPIPFRCVATDIGTGEKVVLSDGSLAEAIRASMSLPAVFSPVPRGSRLLVDGGLVENLPVAEAEAMGAEVVVAVDVSSDKFDPEKLKSFGGVLSRTIEPPDPAERLGGPPEGERRRQAEGRATSPRWTSPAPPTSWRAARRRRAPSRRSCRRSPSPRRSTGRFARG